MDSLAFLCARRVVTQRPLPALPPNLYPKVLQVAFQDGRPLVLQNLVATWPFPELHFQGLLGNLMLRWDHPYKDCIKAIIQGVEEQLRQELEEPNRQSRFRLRVLDMTGVLDELSSCFCTVALARACVEVSRHQQEFQRRRLDALEPPAPQLLGVDVHADLVVDIESYEILHNALQTGASGPLRLKCCKFKVEYLSAHEIVPLFDSLDPSCLRRVELCSLRLTGLLEILPHLTRFPELRSLKLRHITMDGQHPTPESAMRIHCVAGQLGLLPSLRELNLGFDWLPGNLRQILCELQAPLESLELDFCSLRPADFTFLSQSFHASALKRLDLSRQDFSQGLLEPIQLLLEKASASLLYLDLTDCHVTDSHLAVLLPTLLRCSRLRFLGLYGNPLSKAAIKDLLQKTLELPDLRLVVYPTPLDCHTRDPSEFDCDFFDESVDEELLSAAEAEISQLLADSGRADLVWTDDPDSHEPPDYFCL